MEVRIARNSVGAVAGADGHDCRAEHHSAQDRDNSNAYLPANPRCRRKVAKFRVNVVRERHCDTPDASTCIQCCMCKFISSECNCRRETEIAVVFTVKSCLSAS